MYKRHLCGLGIKMLTINYNVPQCESINIIMFIIFGLIQVLYFLHEIMNGDIIFLCQNQWCVYKEIVTQMAVNLIQLSHVVVKILATHTTVAMSTKNDVGETKIKIHKIKYFPSQIENLIYLICIILYKNITPFDYFGVFDCSQIKEFLWATWKNANCS